MAEITLQHITKTFGGVKALEDVSLSFSPGEIHAVIGENGAGKSTVMKILGGLYPADDGEITVNGVKQEINSVADAQKLGINIVYQELNLMPDLTVAENIFLHQLPGKCGLVDKATMNAKAQELLDAGKEGLLQLKSASVMLGYLDDPDATAAAMTPDGWYNTNDVASMDRDGYIRITGRLSRFSKIGGEMVPHELIENRLEEFYGLEGKVAVTARP
ncbi:MAG: ATP-binding cassette domain-containing protein, partial [Victivallales bacterium]|nr:ATP-binding cassette domain-containing protein [Victivallales bacterium]